MPPLAERQWHRLVHFSCRMWCTSSVIGRGREESHRKREKKEIMTPRVWLDCTFLGHDEDTLVLALSEEESCVIGRLFFFNCYFFICQVFNHKGSWVHQGSGQHLKKLSITNEKVPKLFSTENRSSIFLRFICHHFECCPISGPNFCFQFFFEGTVSAQNENDQEPRAQAQAPSPLSPPHHSWSRCARHRAQKEARHRLKPETCAPAATTRKPLRSCMQEAASIFGTTLSPPEAQTAPWPPQGLRQSKLPRLTIVHKLPRRAPRVWPVHLHLPTLGRYALCGHELPAMPHLRCEQHAAWQFHPSATHTRASLSQSPAVRSRMLQVQSSRLWIGDK